MRRIALLLVVFLTASVAAVFSLKRRPLGAAEAQRETEKPPAAAIEGRVLSVSGPVEGALVRVKGRPGRVSTDREGRFSLPVHGGSPVRVTASKEGYFVAGVDWPGRGRSTIRLRAHPREDCTDYAWIDPRPDARRPDQCGNCHEQVYREWSESPHARSATNRRFMNLYEGTDWRGNEDVGWSLLDEFPEGSGVCWSCHVPSLEPDPAITGDLRRTSGVERLGVHCDFCHKIADVSVDHAGLDHGRFALRLVRPVPGREVFFGSIDDDRGRSVSLPLYSESRYCASCHEGVLFGTHAYGEYSEWRASPYAARGIECQDCHMAPTGRMVNVAPGHGGIDRDPNTLANHGSSRAKASVLGKHVLLSLEGKESAAGVTVLAEVRVEGVGHRMPTGYPSRAVILWVRATTADGKPARLLEGPVLPPLAGDGPVAEGGLAGRPGRMYAKVLEGLDGQLPAPYWKATRVKYDTRLMPDQIDRLRFRFARAEGDLTVEARLVYRRFSKFLADQKGWPDNEVPIVMKEWSTGRGDAGPSGDGGKGAEKRASRRSHDARPMRVLAGRTATASRSVAADGHDRKREPRTHTTRSTPHGSTRLSGGGN